MPRCAARSTPRSSKAALSSRAGRLTKGRPLEAVYDPCQMPKDVSHFSFDVKKDSPCRDFQRFDGFS